MAAMCSVYDTWTYKQMPYTRAQMHILTWKSIYLYFYICVQCACTSPALALHWVQSILGEGEGKGVPMFLRCNWHWELVPVSKSWSCLSVYTLRGPTLLPPPYHLPPPPPKKKLAHSEIKPWIETLCCKAFSENATPHQQHWEQSTKQPLICDWWVVSKLLMVYIILHCRFICLQNRLNLVSAGVKMLKVEIFC